jgi:hypothetical protein
MTDDMHRVRDYTHNYEICSKPENPILLTEMPLEFHTY